MSTEDNRSKIRAELAADRLRGANNKELIAKACHLLFWSGTIPNKSNVMDVVRVEGSAPNPDTIGKGLDVFWSAMKKRLTVPEVMVEGVPEEMQEVWRATAPVWAAVAEKLGRKWHESQVAEAQKRTIAAEEAAQAAEQRAAAIEGDVQRLKDTLENSTARANRLNEEKHALENKVSILERAAAVAAEKLLGLERESAEHKRLYDLVADKHDRLLTENSVLRENAGRLEASLAAERKARVEDGEAHKAEVGGLREQAARNEAALRESLDKASQVAQHAQNELLVLRSKSAALVEQIAALKAEIETERRGRTESDKDKAVAFATRADSIALIGWIQNGCPGPIEVFFPALSPENRVAQAVMMLLRER